LAKKKILIVDDDPRITDLLSDFCADRGYEVLALNDSRQTLSTVQDWRPDLVTLDLEMPGKDGMEVLKDIRGCADTAAVPIIIISVVAREAALAKQPIQGVFDKPIKFHHLIKQIQELIPSA
jgi:DNA-binding response OmpR family regulator